MSTFSIAGNASWYADAPLLSSDRVTGLGPTLVVAPHPDDEALGCGGTIALLQQASVPLRIVSVSDGAASHPGSSRYPPPLLADLRRSESLAGLAYLGVKPQQVAFLGLPDGSVPSADALDGARAVEMTLAVLSEWPDVRTVLLPWRRDPHPDHRATWSLFTAALDGTQKIVRRLEYPIWAMVHPAPDDLPRTGEARLWRLDIGAVGHQKRAAILAHRSQTTAMIDDAAIGHCLPESVLAQFSHPWELFIEVGS